VHLSAAPNRLAARRKHQDQETKVANQLYEFTMRVLRGDGCDLPDDMEGAYVPSYVGASDYQAAVIKAVTAITRMHYRFDATQGKVREIPLASWDEYVAKVWPDFANRLPTGTELPSLVESGTVFFGPFAGFKRSV
jgi:hypothetical protein